MNRIVTIIITIICFSSCNIKIDESFYHIPSPKGDQCLTLVYRTYLFDTDESIKNSGLFIYYGKYKESDVLPDKFLKIKYDDCTNLRIAWLDPIVIMYKYVDDDKLDSKQVVNCLSYQEFDEKTEGTVFPISQETFTLDEISGEVVESKRQMWKEMVKNKQIKQ